MPCYAHALCVGLLECTVLRNIALLGVWSSPPHTCNSSRAAVTFASGRQLRQRRGHSLQVFRLLCFGAPCALWLRFARRVLVSGDLLSACARAGCRFSLCSSFGGRNWFSFACHVSCAPNVLQRAAAPDSATFSEHVLVPILGTCSGSNFGYMVVFAGLQPQTQDVARKSHASLGGLASRERDGRKPRRYKIPHRPNTGPWNAPRSDTRWHPSGAILLLDSQGVAGKCVIFDAEGQL